MKQVIKFWIVLGFVISLFAILAFGFGQYFLTLFLPIIRPTVTRVFEQYGANAFISLSLILSAFLMTIFVTYYFSYFIIIKFFDRFINNLFEKALKDLKK